MEFIMCHLFSLFVVACEGGPCDGQTVWAEESRRIGALTREDKTSVECCT